MNREVKFKGKSKKTGVWLYGDLVRNVEGAFAIVPPFEMTTDNLCDRYEVEENTIGQFIGLQDFYDNDIYEGDIMEQTYTGKRFLVIYYKYHGSFCLAEIIKDVVFINELPYGKAIESHSYLQVIGNRWDMSEYANLKY